VNRTSLALGFGWFCGAMTQQTTDSLVWSLPLAVLAGISFGVAEAIWDKDDENRPEGRSS